MRGIFDTHLQSHDSDVDALEDWLAAPPIALPCKLTVLEYWEREKATGNPLAAMALDYLSVPGMFFMLLVVLLLMICPDQRRQRT